MALNSYFDFAENDFQYFKASYDAGIVANMMGAMAQGICEKYMKHLISEYYKPDDAIQQKDFENILRTHSLNRLMKFLKGNMGAEFSKNTQTHMRMIDGFYFSTRYPGDDSIEIDGDDVETCNDAIELCRKEVLELERKLKNGAIRKGIVGAIDLEDYDYKPNAKSKIRATEKTVVDRIPPRVKIRENANIELPHILLLCDDQKHQLLD